MLDDVVLFLRIIQYGSFRKAAQMSNISLSAISKRISVLEERLGHRLMSRDSKNVRLTNYGKVIHSKFENLLTFSNSITNLSKSYEKVEDDSPQTVTISLGVSMALGYINEHLNKFLEVNPNIKLNIIYQINLINFADIQCGIVIAPNFIEVRDYETTLLRNENVQFYCSRSYANKYGVPKIITELSQHKIIGGMSEENSPVEKVLMYNIVTNEREILTLENIQLKLNSPFFMKEMGLKVDAIFPCCSEVCKNELIDGSILEVLPKWIIYTYQVYLIHKRDLNNAESLVVDFLKTCFSTGHPIVNTNNCNIWL